MSQPRKTPDSHLRNVPSIDEILRSQVAIELSHSFGIKRLTALARLVTSELRREIRNGSQPNAESPDLLLNEATRRLADAARLESASGIKRVINATGVILHTNLGRAPLSRAARKAIDEEASHYCTLEYDAATGLRGKRGAKVETLLCDLTGAEDALVVNNCAAAALLILKVLGGDGETLVSRGELVEIGGDFRVPDIMTSSGTVMIEVGTTNRTHLSDYKRAINSNTRLLMRVHPSNYRIVGFATAPESSELAHLAHESGIPLYEDAGSGQLTDLSNFGIKDEPIIRELIASGTDVISFSGDKLLGSAQAGIVVGKREFVDRMRKHPLYRALRSDKLRLVALEATLSSFQRDSAASEVPVIQMLSQTESELEARALALIEQVNAKSNHLKLSTISGESAIGGGAGPTEKLKTTLITVVADSLTAQEIYDKLRLSKPAVVSRISENQVLLDLRTVSIDEEVALAQSLLKI